MLIHLKHPHHGIKQTPVEAEAAWDEKHGWTRYDPGVPPEPVNELRKRGRPRKDEHDR